MTELLNLSGRVVVVTGAGRGLGRAYSVAFAQRGASVVVNDVSREHADETVEAITREGGSAVASYDSVSTTAGAGAIVGTAERTFGRLDSLVNNAGFMRNGYFETITPERLSDVLDVHIKGTYFVTQAAWPLLRACGNGRVVMTSSAGGLFAMRGESNYAAAKAAIYGLCKALAIEGGDHGIAVNAVLPKAATTISAGDPVPDHAAHYPAGLREAFAPLQHAESVAPLVLYLASEECTVNGEAFAAGLGRYARVFVGETPGWSAKDPLAVEPEDIAARLQEIRNVEGFCIPADIYDELSFIAGLIGVATAS
jgi:NAD(P)-dependent dehydrogenase (short-subunit alcohol dehydrogenase family)